MQYNNTNSIGVLITAGFGPNSLGIIRGFGRRGIPVTYIDSERGSIARYSRYINKSLKWTSPKYSPTDFVDELINFGKLLGSKMLIIPTSDDYVLALSKHKPELEHFFFYRCQAMKLCKNW